MASYVKVLSNVVFELDGNQFGMGSMSRPRIVAVSGEKVEQVVTVEAVSSQELWDVDNSHLADFDFLWIQATLDVVVEFIVDDDSDVGEVAFTLPIAGSGNDNEYGVPFILIGDDSYANNTAGFTGTTDVIERIQVKNLDGANDSQVYMVLVT